MSGEAASRNVKTMLSIPNPASGEVQLTGFTVTALPLMYRCSECEAEILMEATVQASIDAQRQINVMWKLSDEQYHRVMIAVVDHAVANRDTHTVTSGFLADGVRRQVTAELEHQARASSELVSILGTALR